MTTFYIEQFGCRATQADAAAIERQLSARGYVASADRASADIVVVNTCTVTAAADSQARQAIQAIHKKNPATRMIVTGCYAQRAPEELAALDGVAWVVGNSHKPEIPRLFENLAARAEFDLRPLASSAGRSGGFIPIHAIQVGHLASSGAEPKSRSGNILIGNILDQRELLVVPVHGGEAGHARPVLKIQDGCDSRCSYCVIPQVRGRSRSLPRARVVEEIRTLAANGAREVVLSGIDLGSYGRDLVPRSGLQDLLRSILRETSIERLRLSSIEPMDVTQDLVALFAASDRLAPHFHMPLQSGSDRILAGMRRWYRAEHYAEHARLVREALPHAAIGADVMAGFPSETEDDHQATLRWIEELPLTHLHVFSFSVRPGTPAEHLPGRVPGALIARRASELRALGVAKKSAFQATQAGRTLRVLTLNRTGQDARGPWTRALSANYLDVRVRGRWPTNQFLEVPIADIQDGYLSGAACV